MQNQPEKKIGYDFNKVYWLIQLSYAVYFSKGKDRLPDKQKILTYLQQKDNSFED